ncbi:hypothetical protein GNI_149850, partial [Gregarina niphandrodes]
MSANDDQGPHSLGNWRYHIFCNCTGWIRVLDYGDPVAYIKASKTRRTIPTPAESAVVEELNNDICTIRKAKDGAQLKVSGEEVMHPVAKRGIKFGNHEGSHAIHLFHLEDLSLAIPILIDRLEAGKPMTWIGDQNMVSLSSKSRSHNEWPVFGPQDFLPSDSRGSISRLARTVESQGRESNMIILSGDGDHVQQMLEFLAEWGRLIDQPGEKELYEHLCNVLHSVCCDDMLNTRVGLDLSIQMAVERTHLEEYLGGEGEDLIAKYLQWRQSKPKLVVTSLQLECWTLQSANWCQGFSNNLLNRSVFKSSQGPPRVDYGQKLSVLWTATVTRGLREGILSRIEEHHGVSSLLVAKFVRAMGLSSLLADGYATWHMRRKAMDISPIFDWFGSVIFLEFDEEDITRVLKYALAAELFDVAIRLMLCVSDRRESPSNKSAPYLQQALQLLYENLAICERWRSIITNNPYWLFSLQDLCWRRMVDVAVAHVNGHVFDLMRNADVAGASTRSLKIVIFPCPTAHHVVGVREDNPTEYERQLLQNYPVHIPHLSSIISDYQNIRLNTLLTDIFVELDRQLFQAQCLQYPPLQAGLQLDRVHGEEFRREGGFIDLLDECTRRLSHVRAADEFDATVLSEAKRLSVLLAARRERVAHILQPLDRTQRADVYLNEVLDKTVLLPTYRELGQLASWDTPAKQWRDLWNIHPAEFQRRSEQVRQSRQSLRFNPRMLNAEIETVILEESKVHARLRTFQRFYFAGRAPIAGTLDLRLLVRDLLVANPYMLHVVQKRRFQHKIDRGSKRESRLTLWYHGKDPVSPQVAPARGSRTSLLDAAAGAGSQPGAGRGSLPGAGSQLGPGGSQLGPGGSQLGQGGSQALVLPPPPTPEAKAGAPRSLEKLQLDRTGTPIDLKSPTTKHSGIPGSSGSSAASPVSPNDQGSSAPGSSGQGSPGRASSGQGSFVRGSGDQGRPSASDRSKMSLLEFSSDRSDSSSSRDGPAWPALSFSGALDIFYGSASASGS